MSRAGTDANLWAHQRRIAIARAEVLRAEREAVSRIAEAVAPDPDERHLPNCGCSHCVARARAPSPMRLPSSRPSERSQGVPSGWNNDFIDGCKDGFDGMAAEAKRKQRPQAKKKNAPQGRARARSCDLRESQGASSASVHLSNSGSSPGLRAMAAPSKKANEGPCTRINFDKRTSRHMHAGAFSAAIEKFRAGIEVPPRTAPTENVKFFARKRPIFDHEVQRGEYDAVTAAPGWAIVHVCGMAPDLLRMHISHNHFPCSEAFGESSTNDDLHKAAMAPLVTHALSGGMSTCLMYGATGSGKTYTISAMQELAAENISSRGAVSVTMLELAGKDVRDLLAAKGARPVTLRENATGELDIVGASVHVSVTANDLIELLGTGQQRRTTCGTLMNSASSRSHMVCLLTLTGGGSLVLVDLAGSERKEDSMRHTAERQREGADINSSLLALKECIRALTSGAKHVPYRQNSLTRVLRDSFTTPGAQLHVVATVAPSCSDAEHSVATLRMASGLCECSERVFDRKEDVLPLPKGNIAETLHAVPTAVRSRATTSSGDRRNFYSRGIAAENQTGRESAGGSSASGRQNQEQVPSRIACSLNTGVGGCGNADAGGHSSVGNVASQATVVAGRMSSGSSGSNTVRGSLQQGYKTAARPSPSAATGTTRVRSVSPMRGSCASDLESSSVGTASVSLSHPNKWSVDELKSWLQRQRLPAKIPANMDDRTVSRWNVKRWAEACGGDERAGLRAFNGLRLEMDRLADEEKRRRKQLMSGR